MATSTYASKRLAVQRWVNRAGLDLRPIQAGEPLELTYASGGPATDDAAPQRPAIEWIEDCARSTRPIDRSDQIPIHYFLDGAQRTLPCFVGTTFPVVESLCAAAVLEREPASIGTLCPGTLSFQSLWIIPTDCGNSDIDRLRSILLDRGLDVRDPLGDAGPELLDDYATMEQRIYAVAMDARAEHEDRVYQAWCERNGGCDEWIVLDGRYRGDHPHAIGLVKSFSRHYLTGAEAADLYRMPEAHRTAAFRLHRRSSGQPITAWYLRLRDATGRDPRHGLVRIEVSDRITSTAEIDAISAALLAERSPRAAADDRWATLLYPIYHLEQTLKRYLDAQTRGWSLAEQE